MWVFSACQTSRNYIFEMLDSREIEARMKKNYINSTVATSVMAHFSNGKSYRMIVDN